MNKANPKRLRKHFLQAELNSDVSLTTLTFFGLATALALTPFAVYRLLTGHLALAAVNISVVLLFATMVIFAWRTGRSALAGTVLAGCITTLGTISAGFLGTDLAWIYVAVTANFLLTNRRFALLANVFLIVAVVMLSPQFESALEQLIFVAAASLITLLNLIFATRVNNQHQELSDLASQDPLTRAGNRRAMTQGLQSAVERKRISPEPVGVVMLDLDNFKRLNDKHGHDAGDQVLVSLAALIQSRIRRGDGFYRFGGEEFVLMLPGTDHDGLKALLSNLCQSIRECLKGPDGPITVSIGAAVLKSDESWSEWLARADDALYDAKRAGRDRIRIAD